MEQKIIAVIIEPGRKARIEPIGSSLKKMQEVVGGYIEAVYPFVDSVALICNGEGKLTGLPLNRALMDTENNIYDVIAGTFFIVGCGKDKFISLTQEQAYKYYNLFLYPERFSVSNDTIIAVQYENF